MNLQHYLERRRLLESQEPRFRELCLRCRQPGFSCFCSQIQIFDPQITFVILIHPIEVRRRIATGRMSHMCLENSYLIKGHDYSDNETVNRLIEDPNNFSVVLYPGARSHNITMLAQEQRQTFFPQEKNLVVFVIDGTWNTARKMIRSSYNLNSLVRVCFSPPAPSNFRVRKQPRAGCVSTLEAIHHTIELIGPSRGFNTATREHDKLTRAFDYMVEKQLEFIKLSKEKQNTSTYRLRDSKRYA